MAARLIRSVRKPIAVQWIVAVAVVVGLMLIGVIAWRRGTDYFVAISAGALWVAIVAFVVSLCNVILYARTGKGLEPFWPSNMPTPLRTWLPPVCLLIGLLFGHIVWH
jgi:hypothetical protein